MFGRVKHSSENIFFPPKFPLSSFEELRKDVCLTQECLTQTKNKKNYLSTEAYKVSQGWELIIKEMMKKNYQGGFHGFSY